jgi:hypothetical protein
MLYHHMIRVNGYVNRDCYFNPVIADLQSVTK